MGIPKNLLAGTGKTIMDRIDRPEPHFLLWLSSGYNLVIFLQTLALLGCVTLLLLALINRGPSPYQQEETRRFNNQFQQVNADIRELRERMNEEGARQAMTDQLILRQIDNPPRKGRR